MNGLIVMACAVAFAGGAAQRDPLASSKQWSYEHAAHLLRRAGFGGTPEQISFLEKLGRAKSVAYLVEYEAVAAEENSLALEQFDSAALRGLAGMDREERQRAAAQFRRQDRLQLERLSHWWIEKMASTPRPLEERLVLFWHGHFTSGYREVKSSVALQRQNSLLRRHASGNFRDFLLDITDDAAMVLYLNTQQNKKGKPNENYARELLELFTMGPGHYTEADIKEAARAFTGITINRRTGEAVYRPAQHDYGRKTFFGRRGPFDPADIISIIMEQPATAEHVAGRFWAFFAYEDPDPEIVKSLARVLRDNEYNFKPMLTAMFGSDAFYDSRARFTHIKSPVELIVGTLRALDIPAMDAAALRQSLNRMGQELFQPPNVKGWDGGAAWITSSTLFNRYNAMGVMIEGTDNNRARQARQRMIRQLRENVGGEAMMAEDGLPPPQPAYDPAPVLKAHRLKTPEEVVDHFVRRLLQRKIEPDRRKRLLDTLRENMKHRNIADPANAAAIRGLVHLILSMPEHQLS